MRKFFLLSLLFFLFLLLAVPSLIVYNMQRQDPMKDLNFDNSRKIKLYVKETDKIIEIPLDEYIVGVVAAEMPANFEAEALKAQAVAARTYTFKRLQAKKSEHENSDLCSDFRHCQAWESVSQLKKKWGIVNYYKYISKIKKAVIDTRDIVITYNGKLIDPVYHSSCGGNGTENAEEVWGEKQPYLQNVECKWDENNKSETVVFSQKEIGKKLFSKDNYKINEIRIEKTKTGRVKNIIFGVDKISGTELRKRLGLKSTLFTFKIDNGQVKFSTVGNGHGVGLCQYGANGMAKAGYNYRQIINYYYTETKIVKLIKE